MKTPTQKPFRVVYYDISEIEKFCGDCDIWRRAPIRATTVKAVDADTAAQKVMMFHQKGRVILRAYLSYRKHKESSRRNYQFFAPDEYQGLMDSLKAATLPASYTPPEQPFDENYSGYLPEENSEIQMEDFPPATTEQANSPATVAIMKDYTGMVSNDQHEQTIDTFKSSTREVPCFTDKQIEAAFKRLEAERTPVYEGLTEPKSVSPNKLGGVRHPGPQPCKSCDFVHGQPDGMCDRPDPSYNHWPVSPEPLTEPKEAREPFPKELVIFAVLAASASLIALNFEKFCSLMNRVFTLLKLIKF